MTELRAVAGPLPEQELGWVAELYGPVDERYASSAFLRHVLNGNPLGPSLHVFALDDGAPVGHCCVVPLPAHVGERSIRAGKFEALVLAPAQRGGTLATELLQALIVLAEQHVDVLFAYVRPSVVRAFVRAGCRSVDVEAPTHVLLVDPRQASRGWPRSRRVVALALGIVQNAVLAAVPGRLAVSEPLDEDAALVAVDPLADRWTVAPAAAWPWLVETGRLQAVDLGGRRGLVRRGDATTGLQLLAWRGGGVVGGLRLLAALRRLAREQGTATVRIQPWAAIDPAVGRACRLAGLVRRPADPLPVHSADEALRDTMVAVNPFFHATF